MKKLMLLGVLTSLVFAADCSYLDNYSMEQLKKTTEKDSACLAQVIAEAMTPILPIAIDKLTKIVAVTHHDNELIYKLLIDRDIANFSNDGIDLLKKEIALQGRNLKCTDSKTSWIYNSGVNVKNKYFDKNNIYFFEFVINKKECEKVKKALKNN